MQAGSDTHFPLIIIIIIIMRSHVCIWIRSLCVFFFDSIFFVLVDVCYESMAVGLLFSCNPTDVNPEQKKENKKIVQNEHYKQKIL